MIICAGLVSHTLIQNFGNDVHTQVILFWIGFLLMTLVEMFGPERSLLSNLWNFAAFVAYSGFISIWIFIDLQASHNHLLLFKYAAIGLVVALGVVVWRTKAKIRLQIWSVGLLAIATLVLAGLFFGLV